MSIRTELCISTLLPESIRHRTASSIREASFSRSLVLSSALMDCYAYGRSAVFIYLIYHDFTRDVSSCGHTNRVDVGDQQRDKNVKMLARPLQS